MRIDVLDADTLARVGWVDVWVSLYWDSPYYSEGSFTLEVRPTAENLQLLQEGRWLVRSDESPRIPMRICSRANHDHFTIFRCKHMVRITKQSNWHIIFFSYFLDDSYNRAGIGIYKYIHIFHTFFIYCNTTTQSFLLVLYHYTKNSYKPIS